MASLRQIMPRAGFQLHSKQLLSQRLFPPRLRHASTTPPPKPRVLEEPDKFRPPSHPSRLRRKPRYNYGPDLSQQQRTKRYPHMMPPEGTFLHWFLTSRMAHAFITLGILTSLVFGIWISDFVYNTPYQDLLPPNSMFLAHPFRFLGRYWEVYTMHVAYVSAETADRRKQKVEDVKKRSDYRKAHGLEDGNEGVFGGWTAKSDEESMGPALREGNVNLSKPVLESTTEVAQTTAGNVVGQAGEAEETYVDFEGKQQPVKRKWFGIW